MATASEIFRAAAGAEDPYDESECTDEVIAHHLAVIDNIIKHFDSPYPLDHHGKPIPPPPNLTQSEDTATIRQRKQKKKKKRGKRAKR